MGHPTCIIEGLACWLTLCILEKIICNSTNSVQISFIETLKLIVFSWTIWWCYWQNVLMINEKNNFLTVSWLSGLLSAEIFISTGEWGVQMPPLTSENSYFLRSGPQGATLVMCYCVLFYRSVPLVMTSALSSVPRSTVVPSVVGTTSGHPTLSSLIVRPTVLSIDILCIVSERRSVSYWMMMLFLVLSNHQAWHWFCKLIQLFGPELFWTN